MHISARAARPSNIADGAQFARDWLEMKIAGGGFCETSGCISNLPLINIPMYHFTRQIEKNMRMGMRGARVPACLPLLKNVHQSTVVRAASSAKFDAQHTKTKIG